MAAIDEETVYDVELQHQTEEPIWTWPDDVVWIWQNIIEHAQHRHNVERCIVMRARRDEVEHGECSETGYHHLEEFQIMIAYEAEWFAPVDAPTRLLARNMIYLCFLLC